MQGSDIMETAGGATGYWATDADLDRVQVGQLVDAAHEYVKQNPNTDAAAYIRAALRDDDPGLLGGEEVDVIVQQHLFGKVVYG